MIDPVLDFDTRIATPWAGSVEVPVIPLVSDASCETSARMTAWLAQATSSLGYATCVLDGQRTENDAEGGLLDILEHRLAVRPLGQPGADKTTYAAALGLRSLCGVNATRSGDPLGTLGHALAPCTAMLIHADADCLGQLLDATKHVPVLALTPDPDALLAAYDSLKVLAGNQALRRALVVTVRDPDVPTQVSSNIFASLSRCAEKYLGCRLHHCDLTASDDEGDAIRALQRWVIPMLGRGRIQHVQPGRWLVPATAVKTPRSAAWSH